MKKQGFMHTFREKWKDEKEPVVAGHGVSVAVRQFTTFSNNASYEWLISLALHAEKAHHQRFRIPNTPPQGNYQWCLHSLSWISISALQATLHP